MSTEELIACLVMRGLTIADLDRFTYGMLINYAKGYDDIKSGKSDTNRAERRQYKQLKAIEPLIDSRYKNGEISREKYIEFKKSIQDYEEGVE